jgi:hypothetical protein
MDFLEERMVEFTLEHFHESQGVDSEAPVRLNSLDDVREGEPLVHAYTLPGDEGPQDWYAIVKEKTPTEVKLKYAHDPTVIYTEDALEGRTDFSRPTKTQIRELRESMIDLRRHIENKHKELIDESDADSD